MIASTMDLNADLGEGGAVDAVLLRLVTSANVAAGGHAGGGSRLVRTVETAVLHNVAVGAHPSYEDRVNFGRLSLLDRVDPKSLWATVTAQIVDVGRACELAGTELRHVKAHGALYHDVADRAGAAESFVAAVTAAAVELSLTGPLTIFGPPNCRLSELAATCDVPFIAEGFVDRGYDGTGHLIPRGTPGAILAASAAVEQAVDLALHGIVTDRSSGDRLALAVQTLCLHSDTPDAVAIAVAVRQALRTAGVLVRPAGSR